MLELKPTPTGFKSQARSASAQSASGRSALNDPQPRRLLLALVLLLVALAAVVVKDRDFWFGTEVAALDSDGTEPAVASQKPESKADSKPAKSIATADGVKQAKSAALATRKQISAAKPSTAAVPVPAEAPAVTTVRTVLPPLDVEVIAGDHHHTIRPGSNATKVELTRPGQAAAGFSAPINSAPINAAEREQIADATQRPSYPLLAQHMNVQGSVVLQAVIGADGIIQDLHVLSGPAILAAAAQQAVREWHFKPVLQNGSPVETQAKITVNFTIKIADGTGTTLAESRYDGIQILSR
jgi:TonB family protein